MYSDDPIADYLDWEEKRQKALEKRPVCEYCGEYIQEQFYYELGGEIICEDCLIDNYRKSVDDYE